MDIKDIVLINSNDLVVLSSIVDENTNLGLCEARGITKKFLSQKTKLSMSTVNRSIKKLLELGYINNGVKQIREHSYYITKEGYDKLNESLKVKFKEDN